MHFFLLSPVEPDTPVRARAWPWALLLAVLLASPLAAHAGSAPTLIPTPTAAPTPIPPCGNGIVDAGETCDPPDLTLDPQNGQFRCRLDCTRCGDGEVQTADSEVCDDGNTVSGCDSDHPQRFLDGCLNSCVLPICADPARIKLGDVIDVFDLHGGIKPMGPEGTIDPTLGPFTVRLTSPDVAGGVVYETTLPAGLPGSAGHYRYKNKNARTGGGLTRVVLLKRKGVYRLTLQAYGDLGLANAHMATHVVIGDQEFSVRGVWEPTPKGWRLRPSGIVAASPP